MRRCQKILLGTLCAGVLLGGIGTGISLVEFSSLEYAGERIVGEVRMETKTLEVEIDPEEGRWGLSDNMPWAAEMSVEADETVPENTVRFQVEYNAAKVTPQAETSVYTSEYWDENNEYVEEARPLVELYCIWEDHEDDMKLFMEVKDEFLADLKEGKLASYQSAPYVESVDIRINPANEDDVEFF